MKPDEAKMRRIIHKKSDFIFHGHIHQNTETYFKNPDTSGLILSAGASYKDNSAKLYSITNINLEDMTYETHLRRYSEENDFWAKDTLSYEEGEGTIKGELKKPSIKKKEFPFQKMSDDVKKFIKHNWRNYLLTEDYDQKEMIELRRNYFHKLNINPSLHNLAIQTIHYLLTNRIVTGLDELNNIFENSKFISENINDNDIQNIKNYYDEDYFENLEETIFLKSKEDIAKLKDREFLRKKEKKIKEKIEKELEKKYRKKESKLKQKEEKLEQERKKFQSKFDDYESFDDLKINPDEKIKESQRGEERDIWYKELGLTENPFPSHIGLEGFPKDIYDNIIVKTKIFDKFDKLINKSYNSIKRKSFLIYGTMGSGKTTLFKYLQNTANILKPETCTIYIPLEAQSNFEHIRHDFYNKLYNKLENKLISITKSPTGTEKEMINDVVISRLMGGIKNNSDISHFILFIDDLHKHPMYSNEVYEFLSGLQIFRSDIHEKEINMTIFIAGDKSWISDTDGLRAIGGSIDRKEGLGPITINNAVEMINKRLEVFAHNKNNPPIIKREYIENIFKMLKARIPSEITFRQVIVEVEKHLENYEFESLKLSEILDYNTLINMKMDLESDHPKLKSKLDNVWDEANENERIFTIFSNIIEKLYEDSVSENSNHFNNNINYYGILYKEGLISKRKKDFSFVWVISKDARKTFEKFEGKYGFKPSQFLPKLYLTEMDQNEYSTEESSRMEMIIKTGDEYGSNFIEYISKAHNNYKKIYKHITSVGNMVEENKILETCKKSMLNIMKGILLVCENVKIDSSDIYDLNDEFNENWFSNPDITEFINKLQKVENKLNKLTENDVNEICHEYFIAIRSSVSDLRRYMQYNDVYKLYSKYIWISDKDILNRVRRNFYNNNYKLSLEKANNLFKNKLNYVIYWSSCLLYGTEKWKRGLPIETNNKLNNRLDRDLNEKTILRACLSII